MTKILALFKIHVLKTSKYNKRILGYRCIRQKILYESKFRSSSKIILCMQSSSEICSQPNFVQKKKQQEENQVNEKKLDRTLYTGQIQ